MQLTPNYNLKKPEGTDPVDIQDFNDNADILDAELNKKADSAGGDISNMTIKALEEPAGTQFPVPEAGETSKSFLGKIRKFMNDFKSWNTGVCMIGQIVNNCVTNNDKLPLSAAQGKVLMDLYSVLNTNLKLKAYTHFNHVVEASQRPNLTLKALMDALPDGSILIGNTDAGDYKIINSDSTALFGTKYGTLEVLKQSNIRCLFLWHASSADYPPCLGYYYNNHDGDEKLVVQKVGTNIFPSKLKCNIIWTGNATTAGTTITLNQSILNFEFIGIQYNMYGANGIAWFRPSAHSTYKIAKTNLNDMSGDLSVDIIECTVNRINNTSLRLGRDSSGNATTWKVTTKSDSNTWSTSACTTVAITAIFGV